jgi:hypothetical protein
MLDWTRLREFVQAERRRMEAACLLKRARARWIKMRRSGLPPDLADDRAGIELAARWARVARCRMRTISRLYFRGMPDWEAEWTAPDDL